MPSALLCALAFAAPLSVLALPQRRDVACPPTEMWIKFGDEYVDNAPKGLFGLVSSDSEQPAKRGVFGPDTCVYNGRNNLIACLVCTVVLIHT